MSLERVREYFSSIGLGQRVAELNQGSATMEEAAQAIGCELGRAAKTMSFVVDDASILVVMAGDAKVSNAKFKSRFRQKATMLPGDQVEAKIGHMPGALCPFAINKGVSVFLDESLKRFDEVYTAGGSLNSSVKLSLDELVQHSASSGWVDVCHGWSQ